MCLLQPCWTIRCSAYHHGSVLWTVQLCLMALLLSRLLALQDIMLLSIYVSAFINPLFCVYSDVKYTQKKKKNLKFLILECSCNFFFWCWESNSGSWDAESTVPLSQILTHMILFVNSRPIAVFCDLTPNTPPCPVLFSSDANHSYFGGLAC